MTNDYWKEWLVSRVLMLALLAGLGVAQGCMGATMVEGDVDGDAGHEDAVGADTGEQGSSGPVSWQELMRPQAPLAVDGVARPDAPSQPTALKPRLETVGASDSLPERIQIHFNRDLAPSGIRTVGEESDLTISPAVAGEWRFDSPSILSFVPEVGFQPGQDYKVLVKSLSIPQLADENGEAVANRLVEAEKPWELFFETPAFDFLGAVATAPDSTTASTVAVTLRFSAPVDAGSLDKLTHWVVGDRRVSATYARGSSAYLVVATVQVGRHAIPPRLGLSLKKGVKHRSGATAGAHDLEVRVDVGKPMEVLRAELKEGQDNFYIDVTCHDSSVQGTRYDSNVRRRVSQRCSIDAASARSLIEVHPKTNIRVTPGVRGFHILGNFDQGSYSLRLPAGLRTEDGGVLLETFEQTLDVPALSSSVQFTTKGRYLPRAAWQDLSVRHRNIDDLKIEVRHVNADNLVFWMSGSQEKTDARNSDLIASRNISVANVPDRMVTTTLPLEEIVGPPRQGVMEVTVIQGASRDVVRVLVTDINLIVKTSESPTAKPWGEHVDVWATHMDTIASMAAVEITAIRPSGAVIARCATDRQGHCRLKLPDPDLDKTPPFAIMARLNDDMTYLKYSELKTELSRGDIHGQAYLAEQPYVASVYGDRDLYRPADTVKVVATLRTPDLKAAPPGMPVEISLLDPRGQVMHRAQRKTNAAGLVEVEYRLSDVATTGVWRARVEVAKKEIATYRFNVEEFVPERMRVEAKATKPHVAFDEPIGVDVHARYLFGASASGSAIEVACEVQPMPFTPRLNRQFHYGLADLEESPPVAHLPTVKGAIGAEDKATVECGPFGVQAPFTRTGRVLARASVFEAGSGRTTMASAQLMVHPEAHYVGLTSNKDKLDTGDSFRVEGVIVDWEGEVVSTVEEIEVEFLSLDFQWTRYWDSDRGYSSYRRNYRASIEHTDIVPVDGGRFVIEGITGHARNGYMVRVKAGKAQTELRFDSRSPSWWWSRRSSRDDGTPRPLRPTSVDIEVPTRIAVGKEEKVTFTAPFKGRALMTIESHEVLNQQWIDVDAGPQSWTFELAEHAPNVYVTALVVKDPRLESKDAFLPERAFGAATMEVERTPFERLVKLTVPDEILPDSKLKVQLDVGRGTGKTFATIAAVDEGILQLTRYKTPNPLDMLLTRRALGVTTFDTIGWSLQIPPGGSSGRTGGGDDGDWEGANAPGRIMPFKPVALWTGLVEVPRNGKLEVELDVPLYRGSLRVMAVVFDEERMGSAEKEVLVRDPLSIQATFPRFITVTDEVEIPVFVSNMTDEDRIVELHMVADEYDEPGISRGPEGGKLIDLRGQDKRVVEVGAGKSVTALFRARAIRASGAATFQILAKSGELESRAEGLVPFRAAGPLERKVERVPVVTNQVDLSDMLQGWAPTSETTNIWLTTHQNAEAFDHLRFLVQYPYGCVEQTTSTTRPLLFVSNLVRQVDPASVAKGGSIEKMVMHGINRVLSMQQPNGGFSYWPIPEIYPYPWSSAYATHMLMDARTMGYDVPQERIDRALTWLEGQVGNEGSDAYIHYVLARAGKGRQAQIRRAVEQLGAASNGQSKEQAYLLKAALYLTGDRSFEKELKNPEVDQSVATRNTGGSFYSDRRRRGMMLNVFHELFGTTESGEALAAAVAADLTRDRRSHWFTTQELVWAVTGLGKWHERKVEDVADARLVAGTRNINSAADERGRSMSWMVSRASEYQDLVLQVDKKDEGALYLVVSSEGVRENPSVEYGGSGLKLTRTYRNAAGTELTEGKHALGDTIFVHVSLQNLTSNTIENIALVDRLPAGWEIENPRLERGFAPNWASNHRAWNADHRNIRDDRLEVFGKLGRRETVHLIYTVRATLAGKFHIPTVEAEAMYDPSIWAREKPSRVEISGPWGDELVD